MSALDTSPSRARSPEATRRNRRLRLPFLALGLSFFLAAIYGGLWRLGWPLPHADRLGEWHGPLMICGFFGTLIGLERSVALGKPLVLLAPLLSCAGALALLAGAPPAVAAAAFCAAAAWLSGASLTALRHDVQMFTALLAFAAACWGVGDLVWLRTDAVAFAAPWWLMFLTLTIAAERLEASRQLSVSWRGGAALLGCVGLLAAGASLGLFDRLGAGLLGAGFGALALWLLSHDIALRDLRRAPHLRFFGVAMALGYAWMGVAGIALFAVPPAASPYGYDMALHAILIGFVLSMAFGHSVIVIPAITGAEAPFHRALYAGLGLLHASLIARFCGDALGVRAGADRQRRPDPGRHDRLRRRARLADQDGAARCGLNGKPAILCVGHHHDLDWRPHSGKARARLRGRSRKRAGRLKAVPREERPGADVPPGRFELTAWPYPDVLIAAHCARTGLALIPPRPPRRLSRGFDLA